MASWFSGGAVDKLNDFKSKVQTSVRSINPSLISKLTLQSPELVAERDRIDNEERHKERVRDCLAEILPWETRDEEMEILVDECREVILGLSSQEDTFTGPFVLAGGLPSGVKDMDVEEEDSDTKATKDLAAAEKSADKLSKLEPLPVLLDDFDLDTHVGLIQRLLKADPNLVDMHSRLSSGGERELIFWKNYFFHCAYTRYEAGLSSDEIWSNEARSPCDDTAKEDKDEGVAYVSDAQSEEEVTFDSLPPAAQTELPATGSTSTTTKAPLESKNAIPDEMSFANLSSTSSVPPTKPSLLAPLVAANAAAATEDAAVSPCAVRLDESMPESVSGADYEFVTSSGADDEGEMDELEAEIAAALGD